MFPDVASLDAESLQELKKLNDETITALQSDIQLLKWQLKQFGPSTELSHEALSKRYAASLQPDELLQKLQEEIALLNLKLQHTSRLTGITIENISRQVLELNETHSKTHFELTLKVLGKVMFLKYEIDELLVGDGLCTSSNGGRVTWMEIQIDREINRVIGEEVTKAIEGISLQSALNLIKSYVKFVSEQQSLIQYFLQTYPDSVSHSAEGDVHCLNISDHNPTQPIFGVEWRVKCELKCYFVPQVSLNFKGSQKLKDMDDKGVFNSAPAMFEALMSEKGIKSAVDCLIHLVTGEEESMISTASRSLDMS